jgi:hypothetical protein
MSVKKDWRLRRGPFLYPHHHYKHGQRRLSVFWRSIHKLVRVMGLPEGDSHEYRDRTTRTEKDGEKEVLLVATRGVQFRLEVRVIVLIQSELIIEVGYAGETLYSTICNI